MGYVAERMDGAARSLTSTHQRPSSCPCVNVSRIHSQTWVSLPLLGCLDFGISSSLLATLRLGGLLFLYIVVLVSNLLLRRSFPAPSLLCSRLGGLCFILVALGLHSCLLGLAFLRRRSLLLVTRVRLLLGRSTASLLRWRSLVFTLSLCLWDDLAASRLLWGGRLFLIVISVLDLATTLLLGLLLIIVVGILLSLLLRGLDAEALLTRSIDLKILCKSATISSHLQTLKRALLVSQHEQVWGQALRKRRGNYLRPSSLRPGRGRSPGRT